MYYLLIVFIIFAHLHGEVEKTSEIIFTEDHFSLPVDITFLIADLKYNSKQGVKICEIQPGSMSGFYSKKNITPEVDHFYGPKGKLATIFCDYLSQYVDHFWLIDAPIDSMFKQKLIGKGWLQIAGYEQLKNHTVFEKVSQILPMNTSDLNNYSGIVYASYKKMEKEWVKEFLTNHPGIILVDACIYPYVNNKLAISEFLSMDEKSRNLKPRWKSYPKQYSKRLAKSIIEDLCCEWYVIKPINALKGRGVLITDKKHLKKTLKAIFNKSPSKHSWIHYSDFSYWKEDQNDVFIVEEFIESDPIRVAHLDNQLFDGTMRVAFFLTYNKGELQIHFVGQEWQLPERALTAKGTMTQKHKSSVKDPQNYSGVDLETLRKVQKQLRDGLPIFYKHLLRTR